MPCSMPSPRIALARRVSWLARRKGGILSRSGRAKCTSGPLTCCTYSSAGRAAAANRPLGNRETYDVKSAVAAALSPARSAHAPRPKSRILILNHRRLQFVLDEYPIIGHDRMACAATDAARKHILDEGEALSAELERLADEVRREGEAARNPASPSFEHRHNATICTLRCAVFPSALWSLAPPARPDQVGDGARARNHLRRSRRTRKRAAESGRRERRSRRARTSRGAACRDRALSRWRTAASKPTRIRLRPGSSLLQ
jgi:hypothetical protein